MITKTKTIVAVVTIALIAIVVFGIQKAKQLKAIFDLMTITPASLPKKLNVNIKNDLLRFDIDIRLTNPTKHDFTVNGFVAKLSKIKVYYDSKYLGTSIVDITDISVPHQNELILHDVNVSVKFSDAMGIILDYSNFNVNKLSYSGVVEIGGVEYEIVN